MPALSQSESASMASPSGQPEDTKVTVPRSVVGAKIAFVHKRLVRRSDREYSQALRLGFQLFFVVLNLLIGIQFYWWVRWAESGGRMLEVSRPPGVEGWLPIEGLMQLKYFLMTGSIPRVHAAGFFLFISFLLMSFAFRKSFCSWLCPVGTASEYLWRLGRAAFHRSFQLPRRVDVALRSLKYVLLAFFAFAVMSMSAAAIDEFLGSSYALIVDVRMLNFFRYVGNTSALVILGLVVASVFIQNVWCRYLCPYGAFLGLASLLSPFRIARNSGTCIDCAKCAKACPSLLPVDKLIQIRSAECTGCLECVGACPAQGTLVPSMPIGLRERRAIPVWSMAAGIAILFFGLVGYAKITGHWKTTLPKQVYMQLVPNASEQQHPMPGTQ